MNFGHRGIVMTVAPIKKQVAHQILILPQRITNMLRRQEEQSDTAPTLHQNRQIKTDIQQPIPLNSINLRQPTKSVQTADPIEKKKRKTRIETEIASKGTLELLLRHQLEP